MHSHSVAEWQHEHRFLGERHERNERRTWLVVILAAGMIYVTQSEAALAAARAAIPHDIWRLGAVHVITTLTGSALIALAVLHGRLDADAAWSAAHVDEDWNMEFWGRDEVALDRPAHRYAELKAACQVLELI